MSEDTRWQVRFNVDSQFHSPTPQPPHPQPSDSTQKLLKETQVNNDIYIYTEYTNYNGTLHVFSKMLVGLFRQETLDIYYIDCRVLLFHFLQCFID